MRMVKFVSPGESTGNNWIWEIVAANVGHLVARGCTYSRKTAFEEANRAKVAENRNAPSLRRSDEPIPYKRASELEAGTRPRKGRKSRGGHAEIVGVDRPSLAAHEIGYRSERP